MNFKLERSLKAYKEEIRIVQKEQNIEKIVRKSIDIFCAVEKEKMLSYGEFLWMQFKIMRKRWWIFQLILICILCAVLPSLQSDQAVQRAFGASASLFIILVVPELWKSQTYQAMEIEAVSWFSLKQIYAARMMLFGIVDIVLLTVFCGITTITLNILFSQLVVQFLFPMTVTACICFGILCSKYPIGEVTAVIICAAWSVVWILVVLNDEIYSAIEFPLWLVFMGGAVAFLAFAIYRTLYGHREIA